jgi:hypothetical protein
VWLQPPGQRYFRHDRDSWPTTRGLPFNIHSDSLEDQLEAEATAASPLNFDHDDKENDISSMFDEPPNPVDGMSVMPASQYRRTSGDRHASREHSMVSKAFFEESMASPYGLGGDGTEDERSATIGKIDIMSAAMRIMASGEQLPPGPSIKNQADEIHSVLGSTRSREVDSVLGSDTTS